MANHGSRNRGLTAVVALLCFSMMNSRVGAFHESRNTFGTRICPRNPYNPLPLPTQSASLWTVQFHPYASSTSQAGSFLDDFGVTSALSSTFSTSLEEPFWKPIQNVILRILEPLADLDNQPMFTALPSNIASIPFWTKLTTTLQRFGENMFLALICVALIQGGIAVFQYRNNPSGELMVPPGLTVGEELPEQLDAEKHEADFSSSSAAASSLRSGGQSNMTETVPFYGDRELRLLSKSRNNGASSTQPSNQGESRVQALLHRASRLMVLLLPWLSGQASFIFQRNTHLLHIGSILIFNFVFDLPQSLFRSTRRSNSTTPTHGATTIEDLSLSKDSHERVVVIGDSLAVGLGTVDQYDRNKTSDVPFRRIENMGNPKLYQDEPGPAFPQAFAKTLAQRLRKPVTWRSAGVDGGDIPEIRKYCLGVIEEEVQNGRVPDVVVLLCGANDMKYFLSNPFDRSRWPRAFRSKLTSFLEEIRDLAPNTTIALPAFPTQMFHKNSPLNVFPLGLLIDSMVGFFDSQKKFVADCFPSEGVFYVGLSPREVGRWYDDGKPEHEDRFDVQVTINDLLEDIESFDEARESNHQNSVSLIAADGVHPNARCYTKWASAIGEELIAMLPQDEKGALK